MYSNVDAKRLITSSNIGSISMNIETYWTALRDSARLHYKLTNGGDSKISMITLYALWESQNVLVTCMYSVMKEEAA